MAAVQRAAAQLRRCLLLLPPPPQEMKQSWDPKLADELIKLESFRWALPARHPARLPACLPS